MQSNRRVSLFLRHDSTAIQPSIPAIQAKLPMLRVNVPSSGAFALGIQGKLDEHIGETASFLFCQNL